MASAAKVIGITCGVITVASLAAAGIGGYALYQWGKTQWKEATGSDNLAGDLKSLTASGDGSGLLGDLGNFTGVEGSAYAEAAAKLKREHPFTPDPEGRVTDDQIRRYLAVCRAIETFIEAHRVEFDKIPGDQNPGLGNLVRYGKLRGRLSMEQVKEMGTQEMSVEEYHYIYRNVNADAYSAVMDVLENKRREEAGRPAVPDPAAGPADPASLAALDAALADAALPEQDRNMLQMLRLAFETGGGIRPINHPVVARNCRELAHAAFYAMLGVKPTQFYENEDK